MIRTSIACALVLALSACGKKDDAKPAPAATSVYGTAVEYEAKTAPLMAAVIATFVADGTSCDKLGADLGKLATDNKSAFRAAIDYEHAHPADKHVLAWSSREYIVAAATAIEACSATPAFSAAMLSMQI